MAGIFDYVPPSLMPTYDGPNAPSQPSVATPGTAWDHFVKWVKKGGNYGDYQNGQPPAPAAPAVHPHPELGAVGIPAPIGQSADPGPAPGEPMPGSEPLPTPPIPPAAPPGGIADASANAPEPALAVTPQNASSTPPGATTGLGGDYGSATPPPDAMRAVVDAAAAKYGVPPEVAYWVGSHESGWNPNATGPQTSTGRAKGAWQFMDGTAKQYNLTDPTDFASSTDAAMRYLADLAQKNGGDWAAAVKQYGTFSTGNPAQDRLAEDGFRSYYKGAGQPGPGLPTVDPEFVGFANQTTTGPTAANPSLAGLPYPNAGQPNRSQALLALAAGLLGPKNPGLALSEAAKNLAGVQAGDREAQMKANALAVSNNFHAATVGNQVARTNLMAGKPVGYVQTPDGRVLAKMPDGTYQVMPGVTPQIMSNIIRQQALPIQQQNADARTKSADTAASNAAFRQDPTAQANVAGARAGSMAMEKKSTDDKVALLASRMADEQSQADNQQTLDIINRNPQTWGQTIPAMVNRTLTSLGIEGNANDLSAAQKALSQNKAAYLNGITGGHMGSIRSFAADKFFTQAVADLGTNPDAAKWIIQMQMWGTGAKQAWRDEVMNHPDAYHGQSYYTGMDKFMADYAKQHPIPEYHSPSAGSSSGGSSSAGSKPSAISGTSNGVSWSFTPGQ